MVTAPSCAPTHAHAHARTRHTWVGRPLDYAIRIDNGAASLAILFLMTDFLGKEELHKTNRVTGVSLLHWGAYHGCSQRNTNVTRFLLDQGLSGN